MRDAESILGKILSLESPTAKQTRELLGITDIQHIINLIDYIADSKKEEAINLICDLERNGLDLEQFSVSMLNYMRRLLYLKLSPSSEKLLAGQSSEEELQMAKAQVSKLTEQQIYSIIKEIMEALGNIKYSPMPSLPLELAIVNLTEGR
jgi:DNA polymerase-3 subunit gamma/tau